MANKNEENLFMENLEEITLTKEESIALKEQLEKEKKTKKIKFNLYVTLTKQEFKDEIAENLNIKRDSEEFEDHVRKYIEDLCLYEYADSINYQHYFKLTSWEIESGLAPDEHLNDFILVRAEYEVITTDTDILVDFMREMIIEWEETKAYLNYGERESYMITATSSLMKELREYVEHRGTMAEKIYDLPELNMKIGARVNSVNFNKVRNRIVLYYDGEEATIDCVHTAVILTTPDEYDEDLISDFALKSSEGLEIDIDFEQHFIALKSFVQVISEVGLIRLMRESYNYNGMNFGFNNAMHSQFMNAINQLNEDIGEVLIKEFVISVLENSSYDFGVKWLSDRTEILNSRFNIAGILVKADFDITIYRNSFELEEFCLKWLEDNNLISKLNHYRDDKRNYNQRIAILRGILRKISMESIQITNSEK